MIARDDGDDKIRERRRKKASLETKPPKFVIIPE